MVEGKPGGAQHARLLQGGDAVAGKDHGEQRKQRRHHVEERLDRQAQAVPEDGDADGGEEHRGERCANHHRRLSCLACLRPQRLIEKHDFGGRNERGHTFCQLYDEDRPPQDHVRPRRCDRRACAGRLAAHLFRLTF